MWYDWEIDQRNKLVNSRNSLYHRHIDLPLDDSGGNLNLLSVRPPLAIFGTEVPNYLFYIYGHFVLQAYPSRFEMPDRWDAPNNITRNLQEITSIYPRLILATE